MKGRLKVSEEKYGVLAIRRKISDTQFNTMNSLLENCLIEAEEMGIETMKFIFSYSMRMTDKSNFTYKLLLQCKSLIHKNGLSLKLIMCVPGDDYLTDQNKETAAQQGIGYEVIPHLSLPRREETLLSKASLLIGTFSLKSMERYQLVRFARKYGIPIRNLLFALAKEQELELQQRAKSEYEELKALVDTLISKDIPVQSDREIQESKTLLLAKVNQVLQSICDVTECKESISFLMKENDALPLNNKKGCEKEHTFKKIAEKMGITESGAHSLIISANRRLKKRDAYHQDLLKNNQPVAFPLTRGELKIIVEGLQGLAFELSKKHKCRNVKTHMEDNLPYEAQIVESLIERADQAITIQNKPPVETLLKEKLKILRENDNYSQGQIAEYLNIDRSTYAYYELGRTRPAIPNLLKLAKLYNVSFSFLIGVDDESEGNISKQARVKNTINMRKE